MESMIYGDGFRAPSARKRNGFLALGKGADHTVSTIPPLALSVLIVTPVQSEIET